jgi:hypothetical protein
MKYSLPLKENHEALWNWLADNPDCSKLEWPGWDTIRKLRDSKTIKEGELSLFFRCFACEEKKHGKNKNTCREYCPVDWKNTSDVSHPCLADDSLYGKYSREELGNPEKRKKYARLIAKGWKK